MILKTLSPCEECALPVEHDDETAVSVNDGADWESSRIWWHGSCRDRPRS